MGAEPLVHRAGEHIAVHHQRGSAWYTRQVGAFQQETAQDPELGLEQTVGIGGLDRLEGVAAHQLGQRAGLVGRGRHDRSHFAEGDGDAAIGESPGGLRAGQTAADDGGVKSGHSGNSLTNPQS